MMDRAKMTARITYLLPELTDEAMQAVVQLAEAAPKREAPMTGADFVREMDARCPSGFADDAEIERRTAATEGMSPEVVDVETAPMPIQAVVPLMRVCVCALVTNAKGQILLVYSIRREGWEVPGGKLEPGETWREGVAREVEEETGLKPRFSNENPRVLDGVPVKGAAYESIVIVAEGKAEGEPRIEGGETTGVGWFDAEELPPLSDIASRKVIDEWRDRGAKVVLCEEAGLKLTGALHEIVQAYVARLVGEEGRNG